MWFRQTHVHELPQEHMFAIACLPLPVVQARVRYEEDRAVLRSLRQVLRDVTLKLLNARRYEIFWLPGEWPQ